MATGIPIGNGGANGKRPLPIRLIADREPGAVLDGPRARLRAYPITTGTPRNSLILGDNLHTLRSLLDDSTVAAQVQLVYIDPPYATQSRFVSSDDTTAYVDGLAGQAYVEFMRERLILLRELLAEDGSIYVHLDDNMVFPIKLVLDDVFGPANFRNLITRVKCNPKNFTSRQYGDVADYLLFYTRSRNYVWNEPFTPWDRDSAAAQYQYTEEGTGRRYKKVPCHAPGTRNGSTGRRWRGKLPPPGKHWVLTPETLDELDSEGRIYWSPTGNPRRKIYLDESLGVRVPNIWSEFRDTQNQNARITGFPTEKNLEMMERIVRTSSNPGGLVLDAFCGSGTTMAACESLGRPWIGIDSSVEAIRVALRRLAEGTPRMGSYARGTHLDNGSSDGVYILRSGLDLLLDQDFEGLAPSEGEIERWQSLFVASR